MDFREFLRQKANAGDTNAGYALDLMGNDARINADWVGQIENPVRHGGASNKNTGFGFNGKNYNVNAVALGDAMRGFATEYTGRQTTSSDSVGSSSSGGGSSSSGLTASDRQLIDNDWAQNNRYYNDMLSTIDPRRAEAQGAVDRAVDTEAAALTTERDSAEENLDRQTTKLNDQYGRGLRSLGENVRNTLQGQQNQIGMYGAGDSSAIDMASKGVADMANSAQGEMKYDLDDQLTDISVNRKQLEKKFENEVRKLNDFKVSKYSEIKDKFDTERNEILNKLNLNDNQRAKALASAGAAAQSMISAVDQTINNRLAQIVGTYKSATAPDVTLADVPEYKSTNITPGAVTGGTVTPALTTDQAMQAIAPRRREENTQ